LLRLLALSTQQLAGMLHERLRAAGFDDQRPADDAAFAHIPGEGIRLTDLARRAGVSKQAMAELVDSLEARGYVERQPDPTDGRAKLVVFGERGWAAVATALDALDDIEQELIERLGARPVAALRRTLTRVLDQPVT
jgi:DNA-binding MarR family transcriptional regulator